MSANQPEWQYAHVTDMIYECYFQRKPLTLTLQETQERFPMIAVPLQSPDRDGWPLLVWPGRLVIPEAAYRPTKGRKPFTSFVHELDKMCEDKHGSGTSLFIMGLCLLADRWPMDVR